MDAGWHTYTYDPGDAGIPFSVTWELPEGFTISETYWPPHETFDEVGLTTYGYSDEVIFTYKINAPKNIPDNVTIGAKINYLICEEICIPQTTTLALDIPKGGGEASKTAGILGEWHQQSKLAEAWEAAKDSAASAHSSSEHDHDHDHSAHGTASAAGSALDPSERYSLITYLLFALIGGFILNLMPCVFPVLSLKALAIAKHAESHPKEVRMEGALYLSLIHI